MKKFFFFKIVVLAFLFLFANVFGSINQKNYILLLPLDLQALLLGGFPDVSSLNEIIAIQKERLGPRCYDDNHKKIPKKAQKTFVKIRNALFPAHLLLQTCKDLCNNEKLKVNIEEQAVKILSSIFPQGVALFLLPKSIQKTVYQSVVAPQQLYLNVLDSFLYSNNLINEKDIESRIASQPCMSEFIGSVSLTKLLTDYQVTMVSHEDSRCTFYDKDDLIIAFSYYQQKNQSSLILFEDKSFFNDEFNSLVERYFSPINSDDLVNPIIIYSIHLRNVCAYTLPELILKKLDYKFGYCQRVSDASLNDFTETELRNKFFRNFFTVLSYICILQKIDLTLPVVSGEHSIAQVIQERFSHKEGLGRVNLPLTLLSEQVQEKIIFNASLETKEPLPAKHSNTELLIIEKLVNCFFFRAAEVQIIFKEEILQKKLKKKAVQRTINRIQNHSCNRIRSYGMRIKSHIVRNQFNYFLFFSCVAVYMLSKKIFAFNTREL